MIKWKKADVIKAFDEAINPPKGNQMSGLAERIKAIARKVK